METHKVDQFIKQLSKKLIIILFLIFQRS